MTQNELLDLIQETFVECIKTAKNKNHDYATGDNENGDALRNFRLVEYLGVCSVETGVLVRICDKISRIANLLRSDPHVAGEKITDTIDDDINYHAILKAVLHEKSKK